jgi:hypothetical protein
MRRGGLCLFSSDGEHFGVVSKCKAIMLGDTVPANCHAGTSNVSSKGLDQALPDQIANSLTTEGHFANTKLIEVETRPNTNAETATRPSQQTQERTRTAQQRVLARVRSLTILLKNEATSHEKRSPRWPNSVSVAYKATTPPTWKTSLEI